VLQPHATSFHFPFTPDLIFKKYKCRKTGPITQKGSNGNDYILYYFRLRINEKSKTKITQIHVYKK